LEDYIHGKMTIGICVVNFFCALTFECRWQRMVGFDGRERKHVSWHGATGYGPSPSRMWKRDIPSRTRNNIAQHRQKLKRSEGEWL